MTLRIQTIVAEQIAEVQAKWSQTMETQTEWILKSALKASAARTDATATMLTKQIDQIGIMVSKLVNLPYNPIVEHKEAETATEDATATALQERPVLPSPTTPAPLAEKSNLCQSSTATGSKSATASISYQDAALLQDQRTAMSDSNSRKRSAEDHPKDVTLSAPAAPPDPKRHTQ